MPPTDAVLVLSSLPADRATELARLLVEERLAACVSLTPVTSCYRWDGAVTTDAEQLAIIKTTAAAAPALTTRLVAEHPYQVPEILVLPVSDGHPPYLRWLVGEVAPR
ncbi:MAG: divalent cation tolerance protein CutA [Kofleriaceae bacterium]